MVHTSLDVWWMKDLCHGKAWWTQRELYLGLLYPLQKTTRCILVSVSDFKSEGFLAVSGCTVASGPLKRIL